MQEVNNRYGDPQVMVKPEMTAENSGICAQIKLWQPMTDEKHHQYY